jgi:threonine dehydrogenase-like Zn-dependent dehydrogenase
LDAVFECCGEQEAIDQAIKLLKPGGHLVIVGIPEVDRLSFDIHSLRKKEITVHNVRRQNKCMENTIELVSKQIDVLKLITHTFEFHDVKKAFELVSAYGDKVIKAIIKFE